MVSKSYRRGYSVAVLVGVEQSQAAIWRIYSQVAKLESSVQLEGARSNAKAVYSFHEAVIDVLRLSLKEGVKSVIVAAPQKTSYSQDFLSHVKAHHQWLFQGINKAAFKQIGGSAITHAQVGNITSSIEFKQSISDTALEETQNLRELLEKRLNTTTTTTSSSTSMLAASNSLVLFSLEETENAIYRNQETLGKPKPEYLLLTDNYLAGEKRKTRLNRLLQIAQNKNIKTRIVNKDSPTGTRLNQLGGIVCLLK
jgi:stalled ribosome rescue protein Dom34